MPAKKGVAKSAAHKKSIAKSVTGWNSGSTKKRDGVASNNKYDAKKRLRGVVQTPKATQDAVGNEKIKGSTVDATKKALGKGRSTGINPDKVKAARSMRKEQQKFSPVDRKDYTKSKKKQASNSKVFGGRPGKGPQGKKGIIMGQSEGKTDSQARESSQPASSDNKRISGGNTLAGVLAPKKRRKRKG